MGKLSRKQRKYLRGKRDQAVRHSLPIGQVPVGKPRHQPMGVAEPAGLGSASTSATLAPTSVFSGIASWPASVKVVLGAILVLLAVGLYRRCTEQQIGAVELAPAASVTTSSPAEQPSSAAFQAPTAPSAR